MSRVRVVVTLRSEHISDNNSNVFAVVVPTGGICGSFHILGYENGRPAFHFRYTKPRLTIWEKVMCPSSALVGVCSASRAPPLTRKRKRAKLGCGCCFGRLVTRNVFLARVGFRLVLFSCSLAFEASPLGVHTICGVLCPFWWVALRGLCYPMGFLFPVEIYRSSRLWSAKQNKNSNQSYHECCQVVDIILILWVI